MMTMFKALKMPLKFPSAMMMKMMMKLKNSKSTAPPTKLGAFSTGAT